MSFVIALFLHLLSSNFSLSLTKRSITLLNVLSQLFVPHFYTGVSVFVEAARRKKNDRSDKQSNIHRDLFEKKNKKTQVRFMVHVPDRIFSQIMQWKYRFLIIKKKIETIPKLQVQVSYLLINFFSFFFALCTVEKWNYLFISFFSVEEWNSIGLQCRVKWEMANPSIYRTPWRQLSFSINIL